MLKVTGPRNNPSFADPKGSFQYSQEPTAVFHNICNVYINTILQFKPRFPKTSVYTSLSATGTPVKYSMFVEKCGVIDSVNEKLLLVFVAYEVSLQHTMQTLRQVQGPTCQWQASEFDGFSPKKINASESHELWDSVRWPGTATLLTSIQIINTTFH